MLENFRSFNAGPDAFGQVWRVEFLWIQNAIAIRHSDAVDVKFAVSCGEERMERVIALRHPALLELSRKNGRPITDPWCIRLAAAHLKRMIESGEDIEKPVVEPALEALDGVRAGDITGR